MRNGGSLIVVALIGVFTGVPAALITRSFVVPPPLVRWIPSRGEDCSATCRTTGQLAVTTGELSSGRSYFICAAAISGGGTGKRPGFNESSADECFVASGGNPEGFEKAASFECLCASKDIELP